MYSLLMVLIIIVCILLVLVVLIQNSKGGGLAANFGGSNQIMGVRRTTDFLEKATWTLAASLLAMSILASWAVDKPEKGVKSRIEQQGTSSAANQGLPIAPAGLPAENSDDE
jgi:preprotein translocase subunit SecG